MVRKNILLSVIDNQNDFQKMHVRFMHWPGMEPWGWGSYVPPVTCETHIFAETCRAACCSVFFFNPQKCTKWLFWSTKINSCPYGHSIFTFQWKILVIHFFCREMFFINFSFTPPCDRHWSHIIVWQGRCIFCLYNLHDTVLAMINVVETRLVLCNTPFR